MLDARDLLALLEDSGREELDLSGSVGNGGASSNSSGNGGGGGQVKWRAVEVLGPDGTALTPDAGGPQQDSRTTRSTASPSPRKRPRVSKQPRTGEEPALDDATLESLLDRSWAAELMGSQD